MKVLPIAGCLAAVAGIAFGAGQPRAQATEATVREWAVDSVAVRAALTRFLVAFENLDWEAFRTSFDDRATVFFPTPEPSERFEGRAAYETRFRQVFDQVRRAASGGPPFQHLNPEDLRIEELGPGAALVTFHLRNTERLARRTIVFRRTHGVWHIVHLHASNVPRR